MCQVPRSHPGTGKRAFSLSKVLWIFPKRRLDKHETVCPSSLRRFVFCQIIKSDTREIFSSRLPYQECLCITKGALHVRGSACWSTEEVLPLNFGQQLTQPCEHLSSNFTLKNVRRRLGFFFFFLVFPKILSYLCKAKYSCTCSLRRRLCTSPGWGKGWRHIRWCWFGSSDLRGATQNTIRRDLGWRERWTAEGKKRGFRDKTCTTGAGYWPVKPARHVQT